MSYKTSQTSRFAGIKSLNLNLAFSTIRLSEQLFKAAAAEGSDWLKMGLAELSTQHSSLPLTLKGCTLLSPSAQHNTESTVLLCALQPVPSFKRRITSCKREPTYMTINQSKTQRKIN